MTVTERLAALLREAYDAESNAANPKKGWCECGQAMDAHAGGWVLLHHDLFIVDRLAARLVAAGVRVPVHALFVTPRGVYDPTDVQPATRIDPDRLARALDNYVLPPMDKCLSYNDAKREVAAAIVKAYEDDRE